MRSALIKKDSRGRCFKRWQQQKSVQIQFVVLRLQELNTKKFFAFLTFFLLTGFLVQCMHQVQLESAQSATRKKNSVHFKWTIGERNWIQKWRTVIFFYLWKRQNTKLAATLGLRPFGLSSATIRDEQDLNTENNNVNDSEETAAVEREIEESKRFFSRFPPVAHHNMVQYSHLGKIIQH